MRKISLIFFLIILLTTLLAPTLIIAQEKVPNCCELSRTITLEGDTYAKGKTVGSEDVCTLTDSAPKYNTKDWGLICLLSTIYVITDWIFTFLMVVVGIFVIIGAFTLVTSAGAPDKVVKGRNYILYAAIGMVVALLAKAVPALVRSLFG